MHALALSLSLFWRTFVVYFALAILTLLFVFLLNFAGFDPIPAELSAAPAYIKAKPTLIYLAFAAILAAAHYWLRINLHRLLWGQRLELTANAWGTVAVGLSGLFVGLAVINAAVALIAPTGVWLTYKLFGALSIVMVGHVILARHILLTPTK